MWEPFYSHPEGQQRLKFLAKTILFNFGRLYKNVSEGN